MFKWFWTIFSLDAPGILKKIIFSWEISRVTKKNINTALHLELCHNCLSVPDSSKPRLNYLYNFNINLINRGYYMAARGYELYLQVLKVPHSWEILSHSKIKFVSPCGHVISSIYIPFTGTDWSLNMRTSCKRWKNLIHIKISAMKISYSVLVLPAGKKKKLVGGLLN